MVIYFTLIFSIVTLRMQTTDYPDVNVRDFLSNTGVPAVEYRFMGTRHWMLFSNWYRTYHGYLAVIVCVLGIIANVLNIVVLTRRNMVTATNCILTGLAVSDGLTMAAYLPFAMHFYVLHGDALTPVRNSYTAACFLLVYASFSVFVHTVSIWLTVVLAVFR